MAAQATLPLVIMGGALWAFSLVNGPTPKAEEIYEHGRGFHRFHYEVHGLVTPVTAVRPHPNRRDLYARTEIADDGSLKQVIAVTPTTTDEPQPLRREVDVYKFATRFGWHEDINQWSSSFKDSVYTKMGLRPYKVKTGPTKKAEEADE